MKSGTEDKSFKGQSWSPELTAWRTHLHYTHILVFPNLFQVRTWTARPSRGDEHIRSVATSSDVLPELCLAPDKNINSFPVQSRRGASREAYFWVWLHSKVVSEFHLCTPAGKGITQVKTCSDLCFLSVSRHKSSGKLDGLNMPHRRRAFTKNMKNESRSSVQRSTSQTDAVPQRRKACFLPSLSFSSFIY